MSADGLVVDEFADFHRRIVHRMLARAHTLANRHPAEAG
jgi:hypothetical protein